MAAEEALIPAIPVRPPAPAPARTVPAAASRPGAAHGGGARRKPAPKPEPAKKAPKKAAAAAEEDDLETFLALPTLILFWVVTYAVLNEEEED